MTMLVQLCIVVVTLAIVAVVTTAIVVLVRLHKAVGKLTTDVQASLADVSRTLNETQALLASAREIVPPAQRVIGRFQALGERAAHLSTAVFDEIETPILATVAVARGVTTGVTRLLELVQRRFHLNLSSHNGDYGHE